MEWAYLDVELIVVTTCLWVRERYSRWRTAHLHLFVFHYVKFNYEYATFEGAHVISLTHIHAISTIQSKTPYVPSRSKEIICRVDLFNGKEHIGFLSESYLLRACKLNMIYEYLLMWHLRLISRHDVMFVDEDAMLPGIRDLI
jgi:hypothetical protein